MTWATSVLILVFLGLSVLDLGPMYATDRHHDHEVIVRVHSVHLMNAEQCQAAADPQTKPPDLGCESACRQLLSTTTIAIYYYYSARKLILIYRPTEGRRLS